MEKINIYLWFVAPSPHMSPFLNALHESPLFNIKVFYAHGFSKSRRDTGYESNQREVFSIFLPDHGWKQVIKKELNEFDGVNIFGAIAAYKKVNYALRYSLKKKKRCFVITETYKSNKTFGIFDLNFLRWIKYRIDFLLYARKISGLLPIGKQAEKDFLTLGYKKKKMFDYIYFVSPDFINHNADDFLPTIPMKIVYVGRLVHLKGVDLLIKAIGGMQDKDKIRLDIIADAKNGDEYKNLAQSNNVSHLINWRGLLSENIVLDELCKYDVLILPSRYDGWGCVVNEALLTGLPVIVSTAAGASDLVQISSAGIVFESESVCALQNAIQKMLDESFRRECRINARKFRDKIIPGNCTEYFYSILSEEIPIEAPWSRQ